MTAWSHALPRRASPGAFAVIAATTIALAAPALALVATDTGATSDSAGVTVTTQDAASAYVVRQGDTLSTIAGLHGIETKELVRANDLSRPFLVRPGDRLEVPGGEPAEPPPAEVRQVPEAEVISYELRRWASAYEVPPSLLEAVTWHESRWRPDAVSPRGAVGVGQVLPTTAEWVSANLIGTRLDPWDVGDNLRLSAAYLRWLIDRSGGDQAAALAAYHQGRTSTLNKGWFPSTRRYISAVFGLRWRFESAA